MRQYPAASSDENLPSLPVLEIVSQRKKRLARSQSKQKRYCTSSCVCVLKTIGENPIGKRHASDHFYPRECPCLFSLVIR